MEREGGLLIGAFRRGGLQLGLAVEVLREVVPRTALHPLPGTGGAVVGGIDLRGTVVPVVDLDHRPEGGPGEQQGEVVAVLAHEGRLLGLLADSVEGILECRNAALNRFEAAGEVLALLRGGFVREDDRSVVAVLEPARLAERFPMVDEPPRGAAGAWQAAHGSLPATLVLMHTGSVPLAVDAELVHTTLVNPVIERSALSECGCLGVVEIDAKAVPVLDFLAFCGLGRMRPGGPLQAFVLRYPEGLLVLAVERILDVVAASSARLAEGSGSLPEGLFRGALTTAGLPPRTPCAAVDRLAYFLLLDSARLRDDPALRRLAGLNTPVRREQPLPGSGPRRTQPVRGRRRQVLTADVGAEVAATLAQVLEIVGWTEGAVLDTGGDRPGLLVSRSRAVPVFDLAIVLGMPGRPRTPTASILVVATTDGQRVGFTVPALGTIAEAVDSEAGGEQVMASFERAGVPGVWSAVTLHADGEMRMGALLDLAALADSLLEQILALSAAAPG